MEFCRRIGDHVLPKGMPRVRYAGLFQSAGREARLAHCRGLLRAAAAAEQGVALESLGEAEPAEPFEPRPHEAPCPKCGKARSTVHVLEPGVTMQALSLVRLLIAARRQLGEVDWRRVFTKVFKEQSRSAKPHPLIVTLQNGLMGIDHPVLQFARLHYEEQCAVLFPRPPPEQEAANR